MTAELIDETVVPDNVTDSPVSIAQLDLAEPDAESDPEIDGSSRRLVKGLLIGAPVAFALYALIYLTITVIAGAL